MSVSYYAWAAAAAPGLVAAEAWVDRLRGRTSARGFGERLNGASHVAGEMVLVGALGLDVFAAYQALVPRISLFAPSPASPLTWVASFLALDFAYWLGHRACHATGVLWALHAVHHQQHGYGLSVGLRGPWLSALQIAPFLVPLAVLGLPPSVLFPMYAAHTVYKLLVHADVGWRFGWLEGILVTPASHRVHHATDARTGDRNFGGVLVLWDRLFGTHTVAPPEGALTDGPELATLDPLENNLAPLRALYRRAVRAGGLSAKLRVIFGRPRTSRDGASEHGLPAPMARRDLPPWAKGWALLQLCAASAAASWLAFTGAEASLGARALASVFVLVVLRSAARFAEGRPLLDGTRVLGHCGGVARDGR